ncbi:MAG: DNA-binding response regulator [Rhodobacteraceae bacterium]|nr:DNA-binding response regulator [Paracoccaceae bacterium]
MSRQGRHRPGSSLDACVGRVDNADAQRGRPFPGRRAGQPEDRGHGTRIGGRRLAACVVQCRRRQPAWREEDCVSEATSYHFVIADDHPLFRGAMRQTLETVYPGAGISEVGSLEEAVADLDAHDEVDLLLLDLSMPGMRGFSGLMYLRAQYQGVPVVIVSATEDVSTIRRCMELGASGFIPKSLGIEVIRDAVASVMNGGTWTPPDVDLASESNEIADMVQRLSSLTPQQVRVLMMLSEGLLNKQIAYELSVSEATVKAHVSAILQKLGVESRTQAVIAASKIEQGQWHSAIAR